ncbi:MAG: DUF2092 domain-containing protein [Deltaproteobacteria bacterium]|nr:DUF2092 domain-containing protein [Deltaproteobacteria bacterium]
MTTGVSVVVCALLALQVGVSVAADQAAAVAAAAPSEESVRARQVLDAMAQYLSSADEFSVELLAGYEVVQESGQKIEFGERRDVSVSRPDKLKIETVRSDGSENLTLFDSKQITLYDADTNVYATAPQTAGIDESVIRFVRDLRMRLPLAPLVMKTLPAELARRVQSIDYVETTGLYGEPTHHIAGRTATVDFEMWITDGKKPLLRRVALTYREAEGHPRFWADFSDWDLDPDFRKSAFSFAPPSGAKSMPFAMELIRLAGAAAAAKAPAAGEAR